jgi:hypothetical protein
MHRAALVAGLVCGVAAPAHADLFRIFAEAHGGGMYGQGTAGDQKDAAFFAKSPHGAYGLQAGAELFIFDLWIEHHQFTNGSRVATWSKIGVGVHTQLDLGSTKDIKAGKGGYIELSSGAFFGVGTGQQVMPPLDNAQISDKGFLIQGTLGVGTHLSKNFDLGLSVPVSWGYFFKQGAANDVSNHYQGVQGEALAVLRVQFGLF